MPQHPYRLMAPGPVALSCEVRQALSLPMLHHRTPEFSEILSQAFKGLQNAFQTTQPVLIQASTGSGGLEAAVVNSLSPGDKALFINSGKFGDRWAKIGNAYGIKVFTIDIPWGQSVAPKQGQEFLDKQPDTRAVFCQVCETSTGALHPIEELANIIAPLEKTVFAVDAITALGCLDLPMDQWGLDIVVAGSQKAFMLPAGLSFIALSEKAWEFQKQSKCPKFFFDLAAEKNAFAKGQTKFSSAVNLIQGLNVALDHFSKENLSKTIARSQAMANSSRQTIKDLGWEIFPSTPSPSVTVIKAPENIDATLWRKGIEKDFNITLMEGQDQLKGKILRIGHMGNISNEDLIETFRAIVSIYNEISNNKIETKTLQTVLNNTQALLDGVQ